MRKLLALLLILSLSCFGAISPDASSHSAAANTSVTYTFTHVMSAAANGVLNCSVYIVDNNVTPAAVSGITYNGVALTQLKTETGVNSNFGEMWHLVGPATGSNTVQVTLTKAPAIDSVAGCISLTGVHQSTPIDATAVSTHNSTGSPSLAITTATDGACVVDGVGDNAGGNTLTTTGTSPTQSLQWTQVDASPNRSAAGSIKCPVSPAASATMSWSGWTDGWTQIVVAYKPAGAAATPKCGLIGGSGMLC